MNIHSVQSSNH